MTSAHPQQRRAAKRASLHAAAFAALFTTTAYAADAQTWPSRTVRIIVPFAAGGPADIYARFLAQRLQEAVGQPFVVDNRPGAGSIIGTDVAAKSAPDGHTLLLMSNTHTINETLIPTKPFALMRDFIPVAPINYSDLLLVVHPSLPVKNAKELVALAKARPKELNYASSGAGTPYHLAGELFNALARVQVIHVPYKGSSEARTSVMSGQTQMMIDAITTMAPIVAGNRVRALASTGAKRSTVLPEVPTLAEAGVKDYEATIWLGIMAPAAMPRAIADRLNAEVTKIVSRADVREAWGKQGATPMSMSVAEFEHHLNADIAKWAKVVKASGAKAE